MKTPLKQLPSDVESLKEIIASLLIEFQQLKEENAYLKRQLFGRKSEKFTVPEGQLTLWGDPEDVEDIDVAGEDEELREVVVPEHTRKAPGRKAISDSIPRIEQRHTIPEEERICACGEVMTVSGEKPSEQLIKIPAIILCIHHIQEKYACKKCEGTANEDAPSVLIAKKPEQVIPRSIATPSLLSSIFVGKFIDGLPYYRQEEQYKRIGVSLSRQNMSNWQIKLLPHLNKLTELLKEHIRSGPLINMDETTLQVLKEPGREATKKSWLWAMYGGPKENPAILYEYSPSRAGEVAKELLAGYEGSVQTDRYSGYSFLHKDDSKITHIGCMAHVRRKFFDVTKALAKDSKKKKQKSNNAEKILRIIRKLYMLERRFSQDELSDNDLLESRQSKCKPLLEKLKDMVGELIPKVPPNTTLGRALTYANNALPLIDNYLERPYSTLDNNVIENSIRPFVIGRKNWLFSGSVSGAQSSAGLYSLLETAKANNVEPQRYLNYLFEMLPIVKTTEDYASLLPFCVDSKEIEKSWQKLLKLGEAGKMLQ